MVKRFLIATAVLVALVLAGCSGTETARGVASEHILNLIPLPSSMQVEKGTLTLQEGFLIQSDPGNAEVKQVATFFADALANVSGFEVTHVHKVEKPGNSLFLELTARDSELGDEGYNLEVNTRGIFLSAQKPAGLFYGVQTLLQLLPPNVYADQKQQVAWTIPYVKIRDIPRYSYRGMHLDVCRHFFPVDFIKKYIDLIAMHKMNTFHWHLTEDQGWRIEIKKYPKLTELSAYRDETLIGHARNRPEKYDGRRYGGYYTQEQIKEIVDYAQKRFVTIIPEIEMPGHALAALAAYPELSCTGGPFKVGTKWGVYDDVYCAGNEQVFAFLEDVLSEVVELFPGKYIHIGGDECPKDRWKECEKCQARIKQEGLKDEHELQSYFIRRIENFLLSKGKRLIGWDEILEGGLAPEATVMSWRGIDGGIAAAKQGHDVIMTPNSHLYFDHYQADPKTEPLAIGGFTTLEKVYSYEPTPSELKDKEAKYILGAQANVWTEYIKTPEHVEYMALPRMCALAEVVWSPKEKRNWEDFQRRLQLHLKRLDFLNVNYAKGSFEVGINSEYKPEAGKLFVRLTSEQFRPVIRYTVDGAEPTAQSPLYVEPFALEQSAMVKAAIFENGDRLGAVSAKHIQVHKALGKSLKLNQPYSDRYPASGESALVDGLLGTGAFDDGSWQGFHGNDLEAIIDLGQETEVSEIALRFIQDRRSWIFMPLEVTFALSKNKKDFTPMASIKSDVSELENGRITKTFAARLQPSRARYVRVFADNRGTCPQGHPGEGGDAWIFADEIIVE